MRNEAIMKISNALFLVLFALAISCTFISGVPTPVFCVLLGLSSVAFVVFIVDVLRVLIEDTKNDGSS